MKKIVFLFVVFLVFSVSSAADTCCIAYKMDSLNAIRYTTLMRDVAKFQGNYTQFSKNIYSDKFPCDSFRFVFRFTSYSIGSPKIQTETCYEFRYKKINKTSYSRIVFRTRVWQPMDCIGVVKLCNGRGSDATIIDSGIFVENFCKPISAIETKPLTSPDLTNEILLSCDVFDINGKMIYSGENKITSTLTKGFYLVKYITNKRQYFKKKIIY